MNNHDSMNWLMWNRAMLARLFGESNVTLDLPSGRYMHIQQYPLPANWRQLHTPLLIVFDNPASIFVKPPDRFYISRGLKNIGGKTPTHYFEGPGFNDMSKQNWARYSFHVKRNWRPSRIATNGSNLVLLLDALHKSMIQAADLKD